MVSWESEVGCVVTDGVGQSEESAAADKGKTSVVLFSVPLLLSDCSALSQACCGQACCGAQSRATLVFTAVK